MHNASNHKRKLACAVSGALLAIGFAEAADIVTEDVKVTATRVEKELMDVNMSVSVLTAEDIRRSSARSVGELLVVTPTGLNDKQKEALRAFAEAGDIKVNPKKKGFFDKVKDALDDL